MACLLDDGLGVHKIVRRVLVQTGQNDVRDLEDKAAGAPITDSATMHRTETVKDRKSDAQERDSQTFASLARVTVRDEQLGIRCSGAILEVLEIADDHACRRR